VVQVAPSLCKQLTEGNEEVAKLVKAAQMTSGGIEDAFQPALKAIAGAAHAAADRCVLEGQQLSKEHSGKVERAAKEALSIFRAQRDEAGEALALGLLADAQLGCRETSKALACAQQAQEIWSRRGDKRAEAAVLTTIVNAYLAKALAGVDPRIEMSSKAEQVKAAMREKAEQQLEGALQTANLVVEIFHDLDDRRAEAEALAKLTNVHIARQEPEQAKLVARDVREIYRELDDVTGEAAAMNQVVMANLISEDDYDEALVAAKDVVRLFRGPNKRTDVEDKRAAGNALHALGKLQLQLGLPKDAREAASDALGCYEDLGLDADVTAPVMLTLAQAEKALKNPDEAAKFANQAIQACRRAADVAGEAAALHIFASLELDRLFGEIEADPKAFKEEHNAQLEAAWKPMDEALRIYRELRRQPEEAAVMESINAFVERSKGIQRKVNIPSKTTFYMDPATRKVKVVEEFDDGPPAEGASEDRAALGN